MTCRKRTCANKLEVFKTKSNKTSTLCKYHYDLQCKAEGRRKERNRKEQYTAYDAIRNHTQERIDYRNHYNHSIKKKLSEYKSKCKTSSKKKKEKYEWEISDKWAIALFKSSCYYCGKDPKKQDWNGIDRKDDTKEYTYENSRSCCKNCNMMKKCYGYKQFMEIRNKSVKFHSFLIDV